MNFAIDAMMRRAEDADADRAAQEEELAKVTAERDEARATLAGSETPPTDAQLKAHEANGSRWLIVTNGIIAEVVLMAWPVTRDNFIRRGATRWTPLDRTCVPCAIPKA